MVPAVPVTRAGSVTEIQRRNTLTYLGTIAHAFAQRNIEVEVVHDEGPAGEVIIKTAKAVQADLIGMTTRAGGTVSRLVLGSVADWVLREALCPILLVRIQQPENASDLDNVS